MGPRNQCPHRCGRNWVRGCPLKGRKSSVLPGSRAPALSHLAASGIRALLSLHPQELLTKAKLVAVLGALHPDHTHTALSHLTGRTLMNRGVGRRHPAVMVWKTPNKEGVLVLQMFGQGADWGKDSQGIGKGREDGDGGTR